MTDLTMPRLESSPVLHRIVPQDDVDELYRMYPDLPRNHMSGCPSCGKNNGYGVDGVLELNGEKWTCNCHDQLQRHKHYLNAGIGATYQFITWDDYSGDQFAKDAVRSWSDNMDESIEMGKGLFIWGERNGIGKTFLATLVLKSCVMAGYKCYMTTFQNMLSSMKSGWKDADFDRWYRSKVDSSQVLLIDDLGKEILNNSEFNKEFARQTLDSLLRTRVQQCKVTMFTSNLPPKGLGGQYGLSVASLLNECAKTVPVSGSDYRSSVSGKVKGKRRIY